MIGLAGVAAWCLGAVCAQQADRGDLAFAYLDFERVWAAHRPSSDEGVKEANRAFDDASMQFLAGRMGSVASSIGALADQLRADGLTSEARLRLRSLRARAPRVLCLDQVTTLEATLAGDAEGAPVLLSWVRPDGATLATATWRGEDAWSQPWDPSWAPGVVVLEARLAGCEPRRLARVVVTPTSLEETGRTLLRRLDAAENAIDDRDVDDSSSRAERRSLMEACASARARCGLLADRPTGARSIELLLDPLALIDELGREVGALEVGADPYRARPGDLWRVLSLGSARVPMRLYAPSAIEDGKPLPVVVAFHGAGGDESMFMDGYGGGVFKTLAETRGFLAVSPQTTLLASNPTFVSKLLASLEDDYSIDRSRVYVLGHSMGTGPTATIATMRSKDVAATCCLAGAISLGTSATMAPTLLVAGALDPILRLPSIRSSFERAQRAGAPVTLRVEESYGHTLLVGDVLPEVLDWLWTHTL